MKSICFFNNKGGVGKTTLMANVAAFIAEERSCRVLVVDADPQCNATQLILGESFTTQLYDTKSKALTASKPKPPMTLYDILRPIAIGESQIVLPLKPVSSRNNRFSVDIIPGDPRVALLEDKLSQAWLEMSGGDIGGVRKTNWNRQLVESVRQEYEFIFFDLGPSLGALNRSVLLGAEFFVTPMGCDVFSLFGVSNIHNWLSSWFSRYQRSIELCEGAGFKDELREFKIQTDINSIARFIGYTVQQYIAKSIKGERRATDSFERIRKRIPETVNSHLGSFIAKHIDSATLRLPDVPHMYSLVPLAQSAACPIHNLVARDGLKGAQFQQKQDYSQFIEELADAIIHNSEGASHDYQLA
jgi:cellulose biosynthesis protein BcsQ